MGIGHVNFALIDWRSTETPKTLYLLRHLTMMAIEKEAITSIGWVRSGKDWKCALDGVTVVSRELVPNVAPKTNSDFENPSCRSPEDGCLLRISVYPPRREFENFRAV
jgi:hypothetical protein